MPAKPMYEVVDFKAGGFFVHGGMLGETYFANKPDADLVCEALNMIERLKLVKRRRMIDQLLMSLEDLQKALKEDTGGY